MHTVLHAHPLARNLRTVLAGRASCNRQSSAAVSTWNAFKPPTSASHDHPSRATAKVPLRIMPLGGSITHGVGSSDSNGYREKLLGMLQARNFDARFVGSRRNGTMSNNEHEGWRGFRIDQIRQRATGSVEKRLPNVLTINAGSNDCLQNFDLESTSKRLGDMLEWLWLASPGATVILSSLLVNRDEEMTSRIRVVNKQLKRLAERKAAEQKKIVFVDMCCTDGPSVADLVEDGIHPNDAGYERMANIWCQGIEEAGLQGHLVEPQVCQ